MLLPEEDSEVFKRWVLPKLETISDADAEVLADYVVALVTAKDTDANIRRNCVESLSDFLQDNTAPFVDEVIRTLKNKSYAPRPSANTSTAPIPSIVGTSTSEYLPHPAHALNTAPPHAPKGPAATRATNGKYGLPDRPTGASASSAQQEQGQRSRKRKQNERETSQSREGLDMHSHRHTANDRPVKQTARRGGKNGRLNAQAPTFAPMPDMPSFDPAFGHVPPFDPTNPMAFLAMAAAFGINLPGMPSMPTFTAQGADTSNIRCVDYDTKGFCAAGSLCPYQHGLEYDPNDPAQEVSGDPRSQYRQARGDKGQPGGRSRAPFSLPGPTHDHTNTTLVVEQIPEDNFSEDDVRDFFGKFGAILDVQLHAYRRLAVVQYETHEAANAAYKSPKVIFENRFVKVYWHKSNTDLGTTQNSYNAGLDSEDASYGDSEMLEPEEIERRQAEAQRVFEERRRKEEEAAAKAEDLDRRLQETNAEILRVRRELARASGDADADEDISQDLATLQAEAENLFAQQDAAADSQRGGYRASYRGRGHTFVPRGRGRGAFRGRGARTGVKRLDNRPRRIAIKDVEPGSRKDEALRQHLFTVPDILTTEPHPTQPSTLVITFAERYQADAFIDSAHLIPDVGSLDMEWLPNSALGGVDKTNTDPSTKDADADADADKHASDVESEDTIEAEKGTEENPGLGEDADMDVAEDEDRWL